MQGERGFVHCTVTSVVWWTKKLIYTRREVRKRTTEGHIGKALVDSKYLDIPG